MSETKTIDELIAGLRAPFPASAIQWKPEAISRDKKKALAVPYLDARAIAERLDTVVGVFGWQRLHQDAAVGIGIKNPETNEWIWKYDVGHVGGGDAKGVKGTASDGFKRAAYMWDIGRYLYKLPDYWVPYDADEKKLLQIPQLPAWALPANEQKQANGARESKTVEMMNSVQRANLIALYESLYLVKGADAVRGLGELFEKEFKHSGKQATFEEAKRLEAKLTVELNAKKKSANARSNARA